MNENPSVNYRPIPEYVEHEFVHGSGRHCHYRPYYVGNPRDGHWEFAYWYWQDDDKTWRYCGEEH